MKTKTNTNCTIDITVKLTTLLLIGFLGISTGFAQSLYLETFSTANLGVTGSGWNLNYGSATWTLGDDGAKLTSTSDYCKSDGTWLNWRDTDGPISWYSPSIDVSSYSYVYLSYSISEAGNLENADYISFYYRYDGGSWVLGSTDKNDFNSLNYAGVLTVSAYSALEFRVQAKTTANNEYIKLDNVSVFATDYIVPSTGNNSLTLCSGNIYDNGGSSANYFSNTDGYTVLTPSTSNTFIKLDFNSFSLENGNDYLYIYDGNSTSAAQVSGSPFTGKTGPTTVTSTAVDGTLTLRFMHPSVALLLVVARQPFLKLRVFPVVHCLLDGVQPLPLVMAGGLQELRGMMRQVMEELPVRMPG